jgi:hypothetical protein
MNQPQMEKSPTFWCRIAIVLREMIPAITAGTIVKKQIANADPGASKYCVPRAANASTTIPQQQIQSLWQSHRGL